MEQEHKSALEKALKAQGNTHLTKSLIDAIQNEQTLKQNKNGPSKLSIALEREKMRSQTLQSFHSDSTDT